MAQQPNIVWIFPDQLRMDALGCYGNRHVQMQTPNIDRIAERGVRFERCYSTSPVCTPSRMCFLTGLYPEQTGVYHNEAAWPGFRLRTVPVTFPEVFAQHGYRTGGFGKTHLPRELSPWQTYSPRGSAHVDVLRGTDREEVERLRRAEPPGTRGSVFPAGVLYNPARVTDDALAWVDQGEGPFLLRLGYLQPHAPIIVPEPFASRYAGAPFPEAADLSGNRSAFERLFGEHGGVARMSPAALRRTQELYYGLVAWLDAQVGRVLDFLEERRLLDNTILVFNSDHGQLLGEGGAYAKQIFAPASQQIPFMIRWDGMLPSGQVRGDLTDNLDLARTLFALAGIEPPAQFGGRDLFSQPEPEAIYATIGFGVPASRAMPNGGVGTYLEGRGWPRRACVRTPRFRLDKNVRIDGRRTAPEEEDIFLADTLADPDEKENLAANPAHADTLVRLNSLLDRHCAGGIEPPAEMVSMTAEELQRYRVAVGGE